MVTSFLKCKSTSLSIPASRLPSTRSANLRIYETCADMRPPPAWPLHLLRVTPGTLWDPGSGDLWGWRVEDQLRAKWESTPAPGVQCCPKQLQRCQIQPPLSIVYIVDQMAVAQTTGLRNTTTKWREIEQNNLTELSSERIHQFRSVICSRNCCQQWNVCAIHQYQTQRLSIFMTKTERLLGIYELVFQVHCGVHFLRFWLDFKVTSSNVLKTNVAI